MMILDSGLLSFGGPCIHNLAKENDNFVSFYALWC